MSLILVTGASTGLGLASAAALADQGHDVVLHARTPGRLEDRTLLGRVRADVYADLADLESVERLAEEVNAIGRLDAVIHNAGVMHGPDVYATNVVAPYVLTARLTSPRRSIYLSSSMHRSGSVDLQRVDFATSAGRQSYETSKLYVTALAMALARRGGPDSVAHAVDPGWVPTRMGGRGAPDSIERGHETQDWLATGNASGITPATGGYWYHRSTSDPHPATRDPCFQDDLLDRLELATRISLG